MGSIATRWRLLSGEIEWEGLLDPLDIDLRSYIIHYGERAGASGDAFINENKSNNRGLPRYAKRHLFSKVGLEYGNPYKYVVKKYLYAATKLIPGKSIFLGFVAVATDEGKQVLGRRDILIAWRGTMLDEEWKIDLDVPLVSASDIFGQDNVNEPKVHSGWHAYYTNVDSDSPHNQTTSCRDQALAAVRELVDEYQNEEMSITVTGHSMGAAIATLNATDIVYNGYNKPTNEAQNACMVTAIVLASPRFGDTGFGTLFSGLQNLHVLRVTNEGDPVPETPIRIPTILEYVHVGKELRIDTRNSPYLKSGDFLHNLEVYLHGVAGPREAAQSGDIELEVNRDIALVNKDLDGVKDEYRIVANWWTEKNKSMVQGDDGHWELMDHEEDDDDELAS